MINLDSESSSTDSDESKSIQNKKNKKDIVKSNVYKKRKRW